MRQIAFLSVDNLLASIVHLLDPGLCTTPVVVFNGHTVVETCHLGKALGICPNAPVRQAKLCAPQANYVSVSEIDSLPYSEQIWDICYSCSPLVEPISHYQCYLDLTGCGDGFSIVNDIRSKISSVLGCGCRIALAPSRLLARLACSASNEPLVTIGKDGQDSFLDNLRVEHLWMCKPDMIERLRRLGIRRLGDLRSISNSELFSQFGSMGQILIDTAAGIDPTPVKAGYPPPRIKRAKSFEHPLEESDLLKSAVGEIVNNAAEELAASGKVCKTISIALIGYGEFLNIAKTVQLPSYTASSYRLCSFIWSNMQVLVNGPVSGIEITLSDLKHQEAKRLSLCGGSDDDSKDRALNETLDAIRSRCGSSSLTLGAKAAIPRREQLLAYYRSESFFTRS